MTEHPPTDDAVTLVGAAKMKTGTVSDNGAVYVGREFAGQEVTVAVKPVEPRDNEPTEDDSDD